MRLKNFVILDIIAVAVLAGGLVFLLLRQQKQPETKLNQQPVKTTMQIKSSAFNHNQTIPSKYTCDGGNINPPLSISNVPSGAQSLVLIVDDPDAPGRTFVHWVLWNIDPKITTIPEGGVPEGAREGLNDTGKTGYVGPCPPSGTHRYFFKLYALDTKLELSSNTKKAEIEKAIENHVLVQTELIGLYSRQR